MQRLRALAIVAVLIFSSIPVSGLENPTFQSESLNLIPKVKNNVWLDLPWWETTSRDLNRNGIVDWLEGVEKGYKIGVLYDYEPKESDIALLSGLFLDS